MSSIDLDSIPHVWRGAGADRRIHRTIATGLARLDVALGGGWPTGELIELLTNEQGIGELQLILPLARALLREYPEHVVFWANVPHDFNAVALLQYQIEPTRQWYAGRMTDSDTAFTIDTAVRSHACALVVGWLGRVSTAQLRRIKLGCAASRTTCVLFRPSSVRHGASPAGLRIALVPTSTALQLDIFKVQAHRPCEIEFPLTYGPMRTEVLR
jgi:protein ImuA